MGSFDAISSTFFRSPQVQTDKHSLMVSLQTAIKQHLNPLFKISDLEIVEALPRTLQL